VWLQAFSATEEHIMLVGQASQSLNEACKAIVEENPRYAAAVTKAAPAVVGAAVTAATGLHAAGAAAKVATEIAAEKSPGFVAETVTSIPIVLAAQAAALVLAPVVIVIGIASFFFDD
jgi:hypothetical protein